MTTITIAAAPTAPHADPAPTQEIPRVPRRGAAALTWGMAALLFALYAALSIRDQQRMLTGGFDLGIFDQTVRAYANGHLPTVALKGTSLMLLDDRLSACQAR